MRFLTTNTTAPTIKTETVAHSMSAAPFIKKEVMQPPLPEPRANVEALQHQPPSLSSLLAPEPRLTARQQRLICTAYEKHPDMTPRMLALWAKRSFTLQFQPSPSTIWKVLKCGKKRERTMCPRCRGFLLHKDAETLQRKKLDELLVS